MNQQIGLIFHTMLSKERSESLYNVAKKSAALDGDFWDVGCNAGGSAMIMKLGAPKKHIHLFDSFEGLPKSSIEDNRIDEKGKFTIECPDCLWILGDVHTGWIPETFKGLENSKIVLAHIDLDLYQGTKDALNFISPRIVSGGSIVVDDYGSNWAGVQKAVDEFLYTNHKKAFFNVYQNAPEQLILEKIDSRSF